MRRLPSLAPVSLGILAVVLLQCSASESGDDADSPTSVPGTGTEGEAGTPPVKPGEEHDGGVAGNGSPHAIGLRANNGKLVTAEGGGGGIVRGDRAELLEWETFTLFDLDGPPLKGGDRVRLRTSDGKHWLRAASGKLLASALTPGQEETFTLERIGAKGIVQGELLRKDAIALRSHDGKYVTVDSAGTSELRADSAAIGKWETLVFELALPGAVERHVTLRANDGSLLAGDAAAAAVMAPRKYVGPTEKLTLIDLDGGKLLKGDRLYLETADHHFLTATGGGGGTITARAALPGASETFTFTPLAGAVGDDGDPIALSAKNGQYVVAESGGGGAVNANRATIGPWETFVIGFADRDPDRVDSGTMLGKHVMGYQGWFSAPGDGFSSGWGHWFSGGANASSATFDLWPDLSELGADELYPTNMTLKGGGPASLFSSQNLTTVRRHFRWMKDAGIDGVALSRFVVATVGDTAQRQVRNVLAGAEEHGRIFFVWYDLTGSNPSTFVNDIKTDWTRVVKDAAATGSSRYLRHRGKPLVGLWGIGGPGPGTPAEILDLFAFFKNNADPSLQATIMAAGLRDWRIEPTWGPIFRQAAVINPWTVGAYGEDAGADNYKTTLQADIDDARSHGIDLLPVVWPGFSWHNLQKATSPINAIPRRGGRFYWHQVHNAITAGAPALFTAMFDEVDEGTAMFKAAPTQGATPSTGTFLTLDADGEALPSDWYLRLGGAAGKALWGDVSNGATVPITP